MKPSTSMMSSPTSVAIAGRGTMDAAMANTSFSKVDECIRHCQYKIDTEKSNIGTLARYNNWIE